MPKPSFDTWTIIFLIAAIQGIFISFVLLSRKESHASRYFLAAITFIFSLILVEYVLFWTRYQFYYPYLISLSIAFVFLFGPLFYLYFKSIFLKDSIKKKDALHFIPFVACFLYLSPFIFRSVEYKQAFLLGPIQGSGINWTRVFVWMGIASMTVYSILIFIHFNRFTKQYKNVERWFRLTWLFFAGFTLSYISYYVLCNFSFFNPAWDYAISFFMSFFIYLVAWAGYRQARIFNGFGLFEETKTKYKNSPVSGDVGKEIIEKLSVKMMEKKYFLYPDLNLDKLAELMQTNKHYLSQAINENLGMNFFEYINSLRIVEAKHLITSGKEYTIIEIAYQVGYNNKVSFNKAFKNLTGLTPTEYKNRHKTVNHYQN